MRGKIKKHLDQVLSHLYINPLERCNLRCKICYTRKTAPILSDKQILEFVNRYEKVKKIETITFCGGEVFTLPYFPGLVNKLNEERKFVQIITNGTIDKLEEFTKPNFVNLIVSVDGLPNYHDANRGSGNFDKSIKFLRKAKKLGFHTEIFSIATRQNIGQIDEFEQYLYSIFSNDLRDPSTTLGMTESKISVTFHPRKPPAYLLHHPQSNVFGETDGFDFLTDNEMIKIMKERSTFPPKNLGCFQIALVSDGRIFGCCEGTIPIGKMNDEIPLLFDKLKDRIEVWEKSNTLKNCLGCSQPDFVCGIKKYLVALSSPT